MNVVNHFKSLNSSSNFSIAMFRSFNILSFSTKVFAKKAASTALSQLPSETIASLTRFSRRVSTLFSIAIFCLLTFSISSALCFLFKSSSLSAWASFFSGHLALFSGHLAFFSDMQAYNFFSILG